MLKHLLILGLLLMLVACGGTEPTNPDPNPDPDPDPNPNNECTYSLSEDITVPSHLINTPSNCDYLLEGFVNILSSLTIDPGVRIVANQDAILWVDGGQIIANGTASTPIIMEGLNHIAGYWQGIRFAEGRESSFDYFHLKDAGQVCSSLYCPDAAFIPDDVTISFSNSSVSNSYVDGFYATGNVLFKRFENNRFDNNTLSGVVISPKYAEFLDAASDYIGQDQPNGDPYVYLVSDDLESGDIRRWKNLNAPYLIAGYLNIEGSSVIIEPGTTVLFGQESWITVRDNGYLRAIGTATERITFKGLVEQAGYWDGITFWDSNWEENEFNYVDVKHSGFIGGLLDAYGGVRMRYTSSLKVGNSSFSDNAEFAIACDEPDEFETITLILGPGNSFSNNASGDIDPACGVTP